MKPDIFTFEPNTVSLFLFSSIIFLIIRHFPVSSNTSRVFIPASSNILLASLSKLKISMSIVPCPGDSSTMIFCVSIVNCSGTTAKYFLSLSMLLLCSISLYIFVVLPVPLLPKISCNPISSPIYNICLSLLVAVPVRFRFALSD